MDKQNETQKKKKERQDNVSKLMLNRIEVFIAAVC